MAEDKAAARLAPEFRVRIDDADLPEGAATDIRTASVQEDVDAPSMFDLYVTNWDQNKLRMKWSDEPLFREGKQVEVLMGYRDRMQSLIVGEITSLELLIAGNEVPTLIVHGYDRGHRLARGKKSRSFANMKDSDIATTIADDLGLSAEVEQTSERYEYVLQSNQTDMEFLRQRADRIAFEVLVQDKKLLFRKRQNNKTETATLNREDDLLEFRPRLNTLSQTEAVVVRSWNPKDKQVMIGRATAADETHKMGGSKLGPEAVSSIFGQAEFKIVGRPVTSQAEADQLARGRMKEMSLSYISGEGVCTGRTDVRAGSVVKVDGLGTRFSGMYYVISAIHTYSHAKGYRTKFSFRRNSS
jgi:phage protein D